MYSKERQQELNHLTKQLVKPESNFSNEEKVSALREVINYHDWRYYVLSEPVITDFDYDSLFKQLKELETQNPKSGQHHSVTVREQIVSCPVSDFVHSDFFEFRISDFEFENLPHLSRKLA